MSCTSAVRTTPRDGARFRIAFEAGERELYATCLHEYAHSIVAQHFGACGFVTIQRLHVESGSSRWQGRFQLFGELDDDAWRVVALAGTLAERLAEGRAADVARLDGLLHAPGALSSCDASLAQGFDRSHVATCIDVLCNEWTAIGRDAFERAAEVISRRALGPW